MRRRGPIRPFARALPLAAGLLAACLFAAGPAAAEPLFADPVRVFPMDVAPTSLARYTDPEGGEWIVVLDYLRRLTFLDAHADPPWSNSWSVEADGSDTEYPFGGSSAGLSIVDIDLDGVRDVVVHSSVVFVLKGRPGGGFEAPRSWSLGSSGPALVTDLDRDGRLDLVSLGDDSELLSWRKARPDGLFDPPATIAAPGYFGHPLGAADLDGDGDLDLVRREFDGIKDEFVIRRFLNEGGGSFVSSVVGRYSYHVVDSIELGRFSGDDRPDLLLFSSGRGSDPDTLRLAPGLGDGSFGPPGDAMTRHLRSWQVADFDGDGDDDLVEHQDRLVVHRSGPDGTFLPPLDYGRTTGRGLPILQDFDGDGADDLLCLGDRSLRLRLDRDVDRYPAEAEFQFVNPSEEARALDMTGDGRADVVAMTGRSGVYEFMVLESTSDGGFGAIKRTPMGNLRPEFVTGDFDGDGDADVLIGERSGSRQEPDAEFWTNDGTGLLEFRVAWPEPYRCCQAPLAADLDGDGRAERIRFRRDADGSSRVIIDRIRAEGAPVELASIALEDGEGGIQVEYLNDDAVPDLLLLYQYPRAGLTWCLGRGDLTFESLPFQPMNVMPSVVIPTPAGFSANELLVLEFSRFLRVVRDGNRWRADFDEDVEHVRGVRRIPDLNGDGEQDILVDASEGENSILLSEPGGGLQAPVSIPVKRDAKLVLVDDRDDDGQPDAVFLDDDRVSIRRGIPQAPLDGFELDAVAEGWQVQVSWHATVRPAGEFVITRVGEGLAPVEIFRWATTAFGGLYGDPVPAPGRYAYRLLHDDGEGNVRTLVRADVVVQPAPAPVQLRADGLRVGGGPFRFRYEATAPLATHLDILNVLGRRVRRMEVALQATPAGILAWDGRGDDAAPVASGVYFARLAPAAATVRLVVVR